MLACPFIVILAQQIAGADPVGSRTLPVDGTPCDGIHAHVAGCGTRRRWVSSSVVVTTFYTLLYLIRPGETSDDHIKRRILEDGREGSR